MQELELKISSREVAKMMGVKHKDLLKKIDGINKDFGSEKVRHEKYWVESNFEIRGRSYRCFEITKLGCEFLAHKTTGTKGNLFTDRYMTKFEEMKSELENKSEGLPTNYIEALESLLKAEKDKLALVENNNKLQKELDYKQDVIVGLVDDIDLAEKRQRITQIVRHDAKGNYQDRYNLLYKEFELKYHLDLNRRLKSESVLNTKPKIKGKMDYIDRVLNKVPQLYEITCKLFESDVEELKKLWDI